MSNNILTATVTVTGSRPLLRRWSSNTARIHYWLKLARRVINVGWCNWRLRPDWRANTGLLLPFSARRKLLQANRKLRGKIKKPLCTLRATFARNFRPLQQLQDVHPIILSRKIT